MWRPTLGITLDNLDNHAASGRYDVGRGYGEAVARAGGLPVMLPHESACIDDYIKLCDGLILTGGVDPDTAALPPHWPGQAPLHPKARVMDPQRQAFELALLDAWQTQRPTAPLLGICLGMQLLCLHHGGRLNQYLPGTHPPDVVERHRAAMHSILPCAADSVLSAESLQPLDEVRSHHQQAVDHAGKLRVIARAQDGIIEAVDRPGHPFCVGVQWHPECTDSALSGQIFSALVNAARRERRG